MITKFIKLITWSLLVSSTILSAFGNGIKPTHGMITIKEDLSVDQYEVTVGQWMIYCIWILKNRCYDEALEMLPDSNTIKSDLYSYYKYVLKNHLITTSERSEITPPDSYYYLDEFSYLKYDKSFLLPNYPKETLLYPVTGITYYQANSYCIWRTKIFGNGNDVYKLPSQTEWKIIGSRLIEINDSINPKSNRIIGRYNINQIDNIDIYSIRGNKNSLKNIGKTTASNQIFDFFGNVSEMTTEEGVAKGGNFTLSEAYFHIDTIQFYEKPENWLGFRCIKIKKSDLISNCTSAYNKRPNYLIDERDGNEYRTVQIANKIWMARNLEFKMDTGTTRVYYNDERFAYSFGYVYDWETAKKACPIGWRLPTQAEYQEMLQALGGEGKASFKELIINGNSGFSALLVGNYCKLQWTPYGYGVGYWSSTEKDEKTVFILGLPGSSKRTSASNFWLKKCLLPVRCIKN